ncbi:MAG: prephenate dehydrogenase, partial [Endomicrobiia bacterium]
SLGLAIKEKYPEIEIIGIGRNLERLKLAKQKGCIDRFTTDLKQGVKNSDIVIVSTVVSVIDKIIISILPFVKNNCLITDVGSIKYKIIKSINKELKKYKNLKNINFIGSHPIAGREKTGVEFAKNDLFKNSVCVICYNDKMVNKDALEKIKFLWETVGAKIVRLDAKKHDRILAATSHFLHIISYLLTKQINSRKEFINFVGGAYRDMTRIAASNPQLWSEICFINKTYVSQEIKKFVKQLNKLLKIINNFEKLNKFLEKCYELKIKYQK